MTEYRTTKRFENVEPKRALELLQGDHGLWRYEELKWYEPDAEEARWAGPCWIPLHSSGLYATESEAEAAAVSQTPWLREQARVSLARLREIGWANWDPIGLRDAGDGEWQGDGRCADEYDDYLLQAAGRLRRGQSIATVAAYLVEIETAHIGLALSVDTRQRAEATAMAISDYLTTLPLGPLRVR